MPGGKPRKKRAVSTKNQTKMQAGRKKKGKKRK
jgi:hypothetical protein